MDPAAASSLDIVQGDLDFSIYALYGTGHDSEGRYGSNSVAGDEARMRVGVCRALEAAGHEVLHVHDFRLAAQAADLGEIDAIVLDLDQHIRCERFIRSVRARDRETPIVAITEARVTWRFAQLEALGAQAVLARPFRITELVGLIERWLR